MPQVAFAGTAEVIEEDYYEYDIPPNITVRLEIGSRVYRLELRANLRKKPISDIWYNDCSVTEIIEGHV